MNVTAFNTAIKDFQAQVVTASVGVLRGYLANAKKVRVHSIEFDSSARVHRSVAIYGAAAYTDGRYLSFPDALPPLADTGGTRSKTSRARSSGYLQMGARPRQRIRALGHANTSSRLSNAGTAMAGHDSTPDCDRLS
jgi:outer membrane receptor protein involved in Fe transport